MAERTVKVAERKAMETVVRGRMVATENAKRLRITGTGTTREESSGGDAKRPHLNLANNLPTVLMNGTTCTTSPLGALL